MNLEVSLKFSDANSFAKFAAMLAANGFTNEAEEDRPATATEVRAPRKAAKVEAAKAPEPVAAKEEAPAAETPREETAAVSFEDVKNATLDVSKKKGRDAAVALLSNFKVARATELKPEQYAAYVAKATEALAA